jgi:hypothetical protein
MSAQSRRTLCVPNRIVKTRTPADTRPGLGSAKLSGVPGPLRKSEHPLRATPRV